jgi:hypothetical protein
MPRFNGDKVSAKYYARCNHLIPEQVLTPNKKYRMTSVYDWCPDCTKEIITHQNDLQANFDIVFGGLDDSKSPASK